MKLFATLCSAALAICGALNAQSYADRITLNFPAPVTVNGVTIPAGPATIELLSTSGNPILAVRSDAGATATMLANRYEITADEDEPKVILDRKGETYHIDRILLPDHVAFQVETE
jgi:hypothetical protein